MKRRMLDSGIWANENFAELSLLGRLLLIGIINFADDQGRIKGNPAYLRSQIFPYDDVTVEDVQVVVHLLDQMDTVVVYEVEGKTYLQLVNWWDYQSLQFASPSHYPRPDGWKDRVRYTGKGRIIYTCNWVSVNGEMSENTCDQDGNPLPRRGKQPPSQPPAGAPSQPPGQPPRALKEDKDKDKEESKGKTKATRHTQPSPDELATAKTAGETAKHRARSKLPRTYPGIDPKLLTRLTNEVKRIRGMSSLIEKPGRDDVEDEMQKLAFDLHSVGYTTPDSLQTLHAEWKQYAQNFSNPTPYPKQLYEFAIQTNGHKQSATTNTLNFDYEETFR